MNGIWLAANMRHGYVHALEHEGDYADGDLLVNVTVGIDGVSVRTLPSEAARVPTAPSGEERRGSPQERCPFHEDAPHDGCPTCDAIVASAKRCTCGAGAGPRAMTLHDADCPMRGVNDQELASMLTYQAEPPCLDPVEAHIEAGSPTYRLRCGRCRNCLKAAGVNVGVLNHDKDKLVAWLREGADELENAHRTLDAYGCPIAVEGSSVECTLAARIALGLDETRGALSDVLDWAGKMPGFHQNAAVRAAQELLERRS